MGVRSGYHLRTLRGHNWAVYSSYPFALSKLTSICFSKASPSLPLQPFLCPKPLNTAATVLNTLGWLWLLFSRIHFLTVENILIILYTTYRKYLIKHLTRSRGKNMDLKVKVIQVQIPVLLFPRQRWGSHLMLNFHLSLAIMHKWTATKLLRFVT